MLGFHFTFCELLGCFGIQMEYEPAPTLRTRSSALGTSSSLPLSLLTVCCRCSALWGVRSIPPVQTPQKFVAQGGGKVRVEHADEAQFEVCFVEHQFGAAV